MDVDGAVGVVGALGLLDREDRGSLLIPELFDTLAEIARLVDSVLDLGPTATAALRRRLTRSAKRW